MEVYDGAIEDGLISARVWIESADEVLSGGEVDARHSTVTLPREHIIAVRDAYKQVEAALSAAEKVAKVTDASRVLTARQKRAYREEIRRSWREPWNFVRRSA